MEIHTLELGRYNIRETDLKTANLLDCWLFWFLHAHEYEADALLKLVPQQVNNAIARIEEGEIRLAELLAVIEEKLAS